MSAKTTSDCWRFVRFGLVSGSVLGLKLLLQFAMENAFDPKVAYALVHFVILLVSYGLHSKVTFGAAFTSSSFLRYFQSVLLIKLADWLLFVILLEGSGLSSTIAIISVTLAMTVIRFIVIKKALR